MLSVDDPPPPGACELVGGFGTGTLTVGRQHLVHAPGLSPIPEDLAPISGVARKPRKVEEEAPAFLEPIKFRYSTDAVVEEKEQEPVTEETVEAAADQGKSSRSRRRRRGHSEGPKAEAAPKAEFKTDEEIKFHYCTEFLIHKASANADVFKYKTKMQHENATQNMQHGF